MEFSPISPRAFSRVLVADASSEAGSVKSTAARCQKVFPSFPGCGICTRLDDVTACGVEQVGDVHEVVHAPFGPSLKSLELPEISYKELALLRRREQLLQRLFRLHDLSGNGMLEEVELTKLNEKIAMLHHGKLVDKEAVRKKYADLFRNELDATGNAVPYSRFRCFMLRTLHALDKDLLAQEMMMEQFVAEAIAGRALFQCDSFCSVTDQQFRLRALSDLQL
eukprot:TRINITY_DN2047_c0_g1_i1.p1 TRINITY_DN2047_c0_g1~~TRINITY_DN2047_c0_g1_i1.p1  ORF type:complete len:223 (-),score=41.65 TRINITY_DN2047_c0_g1_i1:408-1076(-)